MMATWPQPWKERARNLKAELWALSVAFRDSRTPWYAKVLVACIVGYALSPLDLIPDPIPVLGYLDDLILLPLGIALAIRLIPADVMNDARLKVSGPDDSFRKASRFAAAAIILIWLVLAVLGFWIVLGIL